MIYLRAARVLTPIESIANGAIVISNTRIVAVGPRSALAAPAGAKVIDCGDTTLAPGFVDVHIHGSGGQTAMAGPKAVAYVSKFLVSHGVTTWLPTLTSRATVVEMADAIRGCLVPAARTDEGADVPGVHLEGPFVNPKRPGSLRAEWFRPPSVEDARLLLRAGEGQVRLITLAPELPGGLDLVRFLSESHVTASVGHTDATADEALAAIEAGVTHATHTYNAMRGLHHRDPGVVGAVLTSDRVRAELIADGIHVDPVAMRVLLGAKGPHRVALITDAVAPAGLGDGEYEFDGRPITVRDGAAKLANGTIAGSVATLDTNLRRVVQDCRIPLAQALLMASTVPATSVGLADRKGYLSGGRDADIVALDGDLRVRLTMCRGTVVFRDV